MATINPKLLLIFFLVLVPSFDLCYGGLIENKIYDFDNFLSSVYIKLNRILFSKSHHKYHSHRRCQSTVKERTYTSVNSNSTNNNITVISLNTTFAQTTFNVDDFGAKGNDAIYDTMAFEKAWKGACSYNDSATLLVPQKDYLVKPVRFKGPCKSKVTVQIHGTIEASDVRSDYVDRHWLFFDDVEGLVVEGGGTINGNGEIWWKHSCKINKSLPCSEAPTAVTFRKCEKLTVRNLKIKDAQQIQVTFDHCKNVDASNLIITAPGHSPNTDGIHITHTQDIQISNCLIGTGDDCISIVSGSQNVGATNITCGPGHGISIGSLGSGTSEAHVKGVTVQKAKLIGTTNGVRIKTWQGGSGSASDIKFQDIEMHNVRNPIIIDQNYCDKKKPCKEQRSAVEVRNVLYENIKGTSATNVAIKLDCSKSNSCEDIVLKDIDIRRKGGDMAKAFCTNIHYTDFGIVNPLCPN